MREEYGGYLPLELQITGEYYDSQDKRVQAFNSGRTALKQALRYMKAKAIYVPYYICDSVILAINELQVMIKRYHIDEHFMPIDVDLKQDEVLLLVNYFGIMGENIKNGVQKYHRVIVDNTQAFFSEPIFAKDIMTIYSCRKFIGVSDGSYLIGEDLETIKEEVPSYSSQYSNYLIESLEYGTQYAYHKSKIAEDYITKINGPMSILSKKLLQGADYKSIKKARITNYNLLERAFREINIMPLSKASEGNVPYMYPLLIKETIREALVQHKIYIPQLWKEVLESKESSDYEKMLSDKLILLPIDQRYTEKDMEDLFKKVEMIRGHIKTIDIGE